ADAAVLPLPARRRAATLRPLRHAVGGRVGARRGGVGARPRRARARPAHLVGQVVALQRRRGPASAAASVGRRGRVRDPAAGAGRDTRARVEASTAYLVHVRGAWNHRFAGGQSDGLLSFEQQAVTLTVPASFDEEARELTIEAARAAGIVHLTMVEEPTAALYAWIASHRRRLADFLPHGDPVLLCDVAGGP